MTGRVRLDDLTSDQLDQLYQQLDRLAVVRKAATRLVDHGHDAMSARWILGTIGSDADEPTGLVPAVPDNFGAMPCTDVDPLVIEPYRNDCNQPRWAFRCWGTDTCDGWLSLELTSERWAELARERHISEAHPELVANNADESARTTAINPAAG